MLKKVLKTSGVFILILAWFFAGWPPVRTVYALNNLANPFFATDASSWTTSADTATTDTCGAAGTAASAGMATFAYDGTNGNPLGSFRAISGTSNNARYKSYIRQSITVPGSGTVKIKGRFDYFASATTWRATNVDGHIKLKLYDSTNTTLLANLACVQLPGSNVAWTTLSFGSDYAATGGTTYVVRATIAYRNSGTNAATIRIDNIIVTSAPTGLAASAPAGTSNAQVDWTVSTAGTGANGLHVTTPYKVYRDASSPVSTFLANATTNSYTDSSTTGNTTYYYAVTDLDTASVESPLSAEVNILTRPGTPGTPTFTNVKDATLTVNWSAPTGGASSYKIERCSGTGCSNFTEIRTGETGTSYGDSGLTGNTLYRYRVRATNASGDGGYSGTGETTTGIVSITITSDGTVAYGYVAASGTKSTVQLSDTQTAQNNGNLTENFNIKTSNATGGTQWTLGAAPGTNVFVHEFSTNGGAGWTAFTTVDSYQTLATGIAASGTQNFDLRITVPNSSSDYQQKSITVTIQAVAQ